MSKDNIIFIDHQLENHKNIFLVDWCMENPYNIKIKSIKKNKSNIGQYLDFDTIKNFCDRVINFYSNQCGKNIVFIFTGGELTPSNYFIKILDYIKTQGCRTSVIPNIIRKIAYWKKIIDFIDFITLQYPTDYCSPEVLLSVIDYLQKHVILKINISLPLENFDEYASLGESILKTYNNVFISFQLRENLNSCYFTKKQLEKILLLQHKSLINKKRNNFDKKWYRDMMINYTKKGQMTFDLSPQEIILKKQNYWKTWICWSGVEKIIIIPDGDVYKAWCLTERLGNVCDDFNFPITPISCTKQSCMDIRDITVKKQRQICFNQSDIKQLNEFGFFKSC